MEQNKDQSDAAVRGEAVVDVAEVDKHLEAVLRAGGSSMRYFSMPKAVSDMRDAIIEAMRSNAVQVSARAADAPSEPSEQLQLSDAKIIEWAEGYLFSQKGFPHKLCFSRASFINAVRTILSHSPAHRAADALDSQPTVPSSAPDGWISVKDGLPELGQTVLAVNSEYGQRESKFDRWPKGSINRSNYGEEAGYFKWQEPMNNWGSSWEPTHWRQLLTAPASSQPTDGGVRK